ncbi:MAG: hypothetical protein IJ551_10170 [Prevotella sp.]|nr:hypothetical protein [Prevotella sp.]
MTQKRKYEKPSRRVIVLQHQAHLLAGSGELEPLSPFEPGDDPLNP